MNDGQMELLCRSFDDELAADEHRQLDALLEESTAARIERRRLLRMRSMVSRSAVHSFESGFADRVMAELIRHPQAGPTGSRYAEPAAPGRRSHAEPDRNAVGLRLSISRRSRRFSVMAAAIVVISAVVVLTLRLQPRTINVSPGERQTIDLADGTSVELNGGSTLTYRHLQWDDQRRVFLVGEAFFDVMDRDDPFIVETFNARIEVRGTRFNVRSWPDDPEPQTDVALEEGRVAVSALAEAAPAKDPVALSVQQISSPVVLTPGEATSVVGDSVAARPARGAPLDHVTAWRAGGLAFVDQPLGSVFNTLKRRFGVDVRTPDPAIRERLLTYLNPDPQSATDVLSDICHTLDLRYRRTANGFEVLTDGAAP